MLIHQLPLDAAFASLHSSPAGLSSADAANRTLEFGPNRLQRLPQRPLVLRFLSQFTHFFAVLLWVAALLALVANIRMPGQGVDRSGPNGCCRTASSPPASSLNWA